MESSTEDTEDEGSGGNSGELLKSYAAFGVRAVRARKLWVVLVFALGLVVTGAAVKYVPRSYTCQTILMGEGNRILEGRDGPIPLAGAEALIMRHENLQGIIAATSLVRSFKERRPPLLRLKDRVLALFFGETDEKTKVDALVGTLETRMSVEVDGNVLEISVDWTDGRTAADIAEAARESFVKTRHVAEISAFQEKMGILDGHATKLRTEVESLAAKIHELKQLRLKEAEERAQGVSKLETPRGTVRIARGTPSLDPGAASLREQLENKRRKLAQLEADLERQVREGRAKVADLKLRLTPSHPEVVTAEQRVAVLQQDSSEILLLRAEVKTLEGDIEGREALASRSTRGGGGGRAAGSVSAAAEALPTSIMELLDDEDDLDPALREQLGGAVLKYGSLRQELRSARIDLDTAQAAFKHRYKIIVPADAPSKPTKPKVPVLLAGGFFASLLFALLLPVLLELRRGVMVERWQVQHLQLPVLADLRLPPRSPD